VNTTPASSGQGFESDRLQLSFRDDKISRVWEPVVVKHVSQSDILLSLNTSRAASSSSYGATSQPVTVAVNGQSETEPADDATASGVVVADVVVDSANQSVADQSSLTAASERLNKGQVEEEEEEVEEKEKEEEEDVSEKKVITIAVVVCASLTVLLIVLSLTSSKVKKNTP
jgi:hypothetical protein